jgi:hypothetical protein
VALDRFPELLPALHPINLVMSCCQSLPVWGEQQARESLKHKEEEGSCWDCCCCCLDRGRGAGGLTDFTGIAADFGVT